MDRHLEHLNACEQILRHMDFTLDSEGKSISDANLKEFAFGANLQNYREAMADLVRKDLVKIIGMGYFHITQEGREFCRTTSFLIEHEKAQIKEQGELNQARLSTEYIRDYPKTRREAKQSFWISIISLFIAVVAIVIPFLTNKNEDEKKTSNKYDQEQAKPVPVSPVIQKRKPIHKDPRDSIR